MLRKEGNKFSIELRHRQYFYVQIFNDVEFEIEDLEQLVQFQKELGDGKAYPVLIHPSYTATTNSDLIKYMSKKESLPYTVADAFILNSIPQKILAKLYLRFATPERPLNFFTNEDEAIKWLSKYFNTPDSKE
jgi:hypothetical protein